MNLTQSVHYLRSKPLFYLLSLLTGGFAIWWWLTPPLAILAAAYSVLLVALSLIDAKHYILPNHLVALLAVLGIAFTLMESTFLPPSLEWHIFLGTRIVTALLVMAFMLGMGWLGKMVSKRDAMGMGDVKMIGAITLWVDLDGLLLTLLIASLLALPWALYSITKRLLKHRKQSTNYIPFGPYLAIGAWISFMFRGVIWAFIIAAGV